MPHSWQGHLRLWDYLGPDEDQEDQSSGEGNQSEEPLLGEQEGQEQAQEDKEDQDDNPQESNPEEGPHYEWLPPQNSIPHLLGFRQSGNNHFREFDSWWDFVNCANDKTLKAWKKCSSEKPNRETPDSMNLTWSGTPDFQTAVDMALRDGWPQGRDLLQDCLIAVAPTPKVYETQTFDLAGAFVCVPVFCSGDPASMYNDGEELRTAKPIVRIDYNHWVNCTITPKDMLLRGAAVISLAHQLELQGFSTELRIIGNTSSAFYSKTAVCWHYSITYKRAGENLDLDRAAFAIAHPASMRRLAFAILEQHPDLEPSLKDGYGYPMQKPNDPTSGLPSGAIFIPGSDGRETPESALVAVQKAAQAVFPQLDLDLRKAA